MANEKHLLVNVQGDYTDTDLGGEIWQCGFRVGLFPDPDGIPSIDVLPNDWNVVAANINRVETNWDIAGNWSVQGPLMTGFSVDDWLNDQIAPAVATWQNLSQIAQICRVTNIRAYPIGPDGNAIPAPPYSQGSPITLSWKSSYPVGGNAGGMLPPQVAVVMSHRTSQTGRRGRGRVFRPAPAPGAASTEGLLSSGSRTALLNAHVALLEVFNDVAGDLTGWGTRAIVTGAPYTSYAVINQVRVGSVFDTQRRRRNGIPETYTSGSVTVP